MLRLDTLQGVPHGCQGVQHGCSISLLVYSVCSAYGNQDQTTDEVHLEENLGLRVGGRFVIGMHAFYQPMWMFASRKRIEYVASLMLVRIRRAKCDN